MSYDDCKVSKLKFKTNSAVTKKKHKRKKEPKEVVIVKDPDSDSEEYGGWWKVSRLRLSAFQKAFYIISVMLQFFTSDLDLDSCQNR